MLRNLLTLSRPLARHSAETGRAFDLPVIVLVLLVFAALLWKRAISSI